MCCTNKYNDTQRALLFSHAVVFQLQNEIHPTAVFINLLKPINTNKVHRANHNIISSFAEMRRERILSLQITSQDEEKNIYTVLHI